MGSVIGDPLPRMTGLTTRWASTAMKRSIALDVPGEMISASEFCDGLLNTASAREMKQNAVIADCEQVGSANRGKGEVCQARICLNHLGLNVPQNGYPSERGEQEDAFDGQAVETCERAQKRGGGAWFCDGVDRIWIYHCPCGRFAQGRPSHRSLRPP